MISIVDLLYASIGGIIGMICLGWWCRHCCCPRRNHREIMGFNNYNSPQYPMIRLEINNVENRRRLIRYLEMNPDIIPIAKRGTESYALAHVTDWYPTILSMVGVQAANLAVPGKPLDGVNMWESLVNGKYDPGNGQRSEMLYALDNIVGPEGEGPSLKRAANSWVSHIYSLR